MQENKHAHTHWKIKIHKGTPKKKNLKLKIIFPQAQKNIRRTILSLPSLPLYTTCILSILNINDYVKCVFDLTANLRVLLPLTGMEPKLVGSMSHFSSSSSSLASSERHLNPPLLFLLSVAKTLLLSLKLPFIYIKINRIGHKYWTALLMQTKR